MKRYRSVDTDRENITDEEIAGLRPPFENIIDRMDSFTSAPRKPYIRYIIATTISAAAVAVIVLLWHLFFINGSDKTVQDDRLQLAEAMPLRSVTPPEPDMVSYEHFSVKPAAGGIFTTKKGSKISVPANAFIYADGTPCKGDVELKFAEYHNIVEIFLSGIPMQYDSAGITYTFESAGMFDIRAYSGDNTLMLAEGKGINVDLVSDATDQFNFYYFDTLAGRWEYQYTEAVADRGRGPSAPAVNPPSPSGSINVMEPVIEIEKPEPAPVTDASPAQIIKKRDKRNFAFRIDYDESLFPELAGMKDVLFEITDATADKKYLRGTWDSIDLARNNDMTYTITLYRLRKSLTFNARPVLDAEAYDRTIGEFRLAEARREEAREEQRRDALAKRAAIVKGNTEIQLMAATRGATVINMGIHNWDIPVPMPVQAKAGKGVFIDENGNRLKPSELFVAQKGVRILWNYKQGQDWLFSKSKENILWFILGDGRYAIVSDEVLKSGQIRLTTQLVSKEEALAVISRYI